MVIVAAFVVIFTALAGMTSVLLVFQLGQPRIFMAMARDGLLPQYFARIHPRFRTPYITTIWTGIIVGGVAMLTDIGSLSDLTNIGTLFAFILVCLGVIVLRRTNPARPRPFRAHARSQSHPRPSGDRLAAALRASRFFVFA